MSAPAKPAAPPLAITAELLVRAGAHPAGAARYAAPLAASCAKRGLATTAERIDISGLILTESGAMQAVEEDLYYTSAEHAFDVFRSHFASPAAAVPYLRNPRALGDHVYAGLGGYDARGLGGGQVTGLPNHRAYAADIGRDLADAQAFMLTPDGAMDSAVWYFVHTGCRRFSLTGDPAGERRIWAGTPASRTPYGLSEFLKWRGQMLHAAGQSGAAVAVHAGAGTGARPAASPHDPADALNAAELTTIQEGGDAA